MKKHLLAISVLAASWILAYAIYGPELQSWVHVIGFTAGVITTRIRY